MLVYLDSFSYMSYTVLCGELLLHVPCCFMWGVCLTRPLLFYVGTFSYMPPRCFVWGVSLTRPCCFMWGVSLTRLMLFYVTSFSYTPLAVLCREFLLHAPCCFMWGVSLTPPLLFHVGSFSLTCPCVLCGEFVLHAPAVLCGEFLLHAPCCCFLWGVSLTAPCCFMCGVSLKRLMLFYAGSFSYTPLAVLCGEFHVHASCCVMWGVSLTRPLLCYVGSFSYTPLAVLCGQFLLYAPCFFFFLCRELLLHTPGSLMYGGFLASSSLLWPEIWQSNARTRCVGWSLCTVPQIKQVSVVIKMTRQMNLTGRANPSLIERYIPGVHGVAIGICLWLTQLVWIRLGTDRQRLRANTTSVPTPSVIGFCFTSLVLFSFFLSFTFTSDGLIVMTVAASISGDIVYSISNLKWMDGCPMRCFGGGVGWEGCFSFTWPMLFYVGNCSYTLRAVLYGGVLLH